MENLEKKIETAKKLAEARHVKFIASTFQTIKGVDGVLIKLPESSDRNLHDVKIKRFVILNDPDMIISILPHFQKIMTIGKEIMVINYYNFGLKDFEVGEVLANVFVVEETNYEKDQNGKKSFVLDIYKNENPNIKKAFFKLEILVLNGEFNIPMTKRFINFYQLRNDQKIIGSKKLILIKKN